MPEEQLMLAVGVIKNPFLFFFWRLILPLAVLGLIAFIAVWIRKRNR